MTRRKLPSNASVATEGENGRMIAPAATRNSDVLCDLLAEWAPATGRALEIASGTGQHVSAFANRLPGLHWHPTEIDADRRKSIDAYAVEFPNIAQAAELNATQTGWHSSISEFDLIVLINLVHLISWPETQALVSEVSKALAPQGRFVLYGPFQRSGRLTSEGDEKFHNALIQQDPEIGYKDDTDILNLLAYHGLSLVKLVEMPANNLAFIVERRK